MQKLIDCLTAIHLRPSLMLMRLFLHVGTLAATATTAAGTGMADWLQHLQIHLPPMVVPGPNIAGGNCSGLSYRTLETQDLGSSDQVEVRFHISGVDLSCSLLLEVVEGTLMADFTLSESVVSLTLASAPLAVGTPAVSLPLGPVHVTGCSVDPRVKFINFRGESVMTPMLQGLHDQIRGLINMHAQSVVCQMLSDAASEQMSQVTSRVATYLGSFVGAGPPDKLPQAKVELTDWAQYPPIQVMKHMIAERPEAIKELISLASPLQIPVVPLIERPVSHEVKTATENISSTWSLHSVLVEGLETVQERRLAVDGRGALLDVAGAFSQVTVRLGMSVRVDDMKGQVVSSYPLEETMNLTMTLDNCSLGLHILAMLSKDSLFGLWVDQLQEPSCYAECAQEAASDASLGMWDWSVDMSPTLHLEMPGAAGDLATSLDATVAALLRSSKPTVESLLKGWIQVKREKLNAAMWEGLRTLEPCGDTKLYLGPPAWVNFVLLWGSAFMLVVGIVATLYQCLMRPSTEDEERRNSSHLMLLDSPGNSPITRPRSARSPQTSVVPLPEFVEAACGNAEASPRQDCRTSLANDPVVPPSVGLLFTVMVISSILLFLYSDLCLATEINFVFRSNGETLVIGPALAFSVAICALNAFQAGAYLIAACIGLLSILWPFVKLCLLAFAWRAGPEVLSLRARDRLLRILDEYGKWSLIDTWLGILALACYRLGWQSKQTDTHFFVDPQPQLPFFTFVGASVLGLILGHLASGYHRRSMEESDTAHKTKHVDPALANPRSLCFYAPWRIGLLLVIGLPILAGLIVTGAFSHTFKMVESGALAVLMLEVPDRVTWYGLVDLGMEMTTGRSNIGLIMVQFIFFLFSLVIPVTLQLAFLTLWLWPMSYGSQLMMIDVCRALDAWAAFDVFAVAVTVAWLEFGIFSTFLMHYNNLQQGCSLVGHYLHTECFHMECYLTPGFGVLLAGAVLSYVLPRFIFTQCHAALEERLKETNNTDTLASSSDEDSEDDTSSHLTGEGPSEWLPGLLQHPLSKLAAKPVQ